MKQIVIDTRQFIADLFRQHITPFRLLYWFVALATWRHSALGLSTLEDGNVILGALGAIAIDLAMLLAAERLRTDRSLWLVAGLVVASLASVYSQALFTVSNSQEIVIAPGAMWMEYAAQWIIDLRVVIIPLLLPAQVVIFAIASQSKSRVATGEVPHTKGRLCQALYGLVPEAGPAKVAAAATSLLGEEVSMATASRSR